MSHEARVAAHIVEEGVRGVPKTAQCGLPESSRRQQATVLANRVISAKHQSSLQSVWAVLHTSKLFRMGPKRRQNVNNIAGLSP